MFLGPALFGLLSIQCGAVEVTSAGCPELLGPDRITPGQTADVTGTGFSKDGCGPWLGPGCASSRSAPVPRQNVVITLHQDGTSWELATEDANSELVIVAEVVVPNDVEVGDAMLKADTAELEVAVEAAP